MMAPTAAAADPVADVAVESALDLTLGKIGRAVFEVDASLEAVEHRVLTRKELLAAAPQPVLLILIDAGDGRLGLMWLDPLLINALIEVMTGAPDKSVFHELRPPTLIDAALCQDFCARILSDLPAELAEMAGREVLPELVYMRHETQIQKLEYTLDNTDYLLIGGRVNFQAGIRGGGLMLALPLNLWATKDDSQTAATTGAKLDSVMCAAPLELQVELDVVSMTVARAVGLKPGDVIAISTAALSDLTLRTRQGVALFKGRLGQKDGRKAVSLTGSTAASCRSGVDSGAMDCEPAAAPLEMGEPALLPEAGDPDPAFGPDLTI